MPPLYVPPPDEGDPDPVNGTVYAAGERSGLGLEAIRGLEDSDLVLWFPRHAAVIAGDTLIDRGDGLIFPLDWAERRGDPEVLKQPLDEAARALGRRRAADPWIADRPGGTPSAH